jgi:ribose/xylose/arabinose/galactoside ABC-type transport system permease subunit
VLLQVSTVVLVAIGMTLVISTRGIDLSVGSVMAVSAAIVATTIDRGCSSRCPPRSPARWSWG